jgi:RNA polymerase sigma-54 factor
MKLAPQIIMSIEILQLPALELSEHIAQQLEENPALDVKDVADEPAVEATADDSRADGEGDQTLLREIEGALDAMEDYDREWGDTIPKRVADPEAGDRKLEAMNNTPSRPVSLRDHLAQAYSLLDLPPRVQAFGEYIIFDLDEAGLLQYDLEEIRRDYNRPRLAVDPFGAVSSREAEQALQALQDMRDPPGVGARNPRECLILQLDEGDPEYELKRLLIEEHLEDIQKNRLPRIEKATGRDRETVKRAIREVQALTMKPGGDHGDDRRVYVTPEVVVEYRDGEWVVTLENTYLPPLRVTPWVRKLMEDERRAAQTGGDRLSRETKEYLMKKFEGATRLIDAIRQRQSTLERVAREIFKEQQGFLEGGISELKPLKMAQVAETLGIHVSTVSRAIADKWAQTPRGIFPLKFFFTGGTATDEGESLARASIKQLVHRIVEEEDKQNPLSDEEIAGRLKEQHGLDIARRTVTKYRKALRIPSSRQRREY